MAKVTFRFATGEEIAAYAQNGENLLELARNVHFIYKQERNKARNVGNGHHACQ